MRAFTICTLTLLAAAATAAADQCGDDRVWYGCQTKRITTVVCGKMDDGRRLLDDIAAAGGIAHTLELLREHRDHYPTCDVPLGQQTYYVGRLVYRVGPLILVDSPIETMPFITLESDYVEEPRFDR